MKNEIETREKGNDPAITIVMAAYNAETYVARAIESVQAQTFSDWELICIDDGSADSTWSIIKSYCVIDDRIKLISQSNAGPAEARRKGYIAGTGAYFIILDSDDWLGPEALEKLLTEAQQTKAHGVVCQAMLLEAETDRWISFHQKSGIKREQHLTGQEAFALTFPWKIHGIALWHKDVIKAAAIDPENAFNKYNSDEYLTRKLFLQCSNVFIGSEEYFIYPNQGSITRKRSWLQFMSLETDRKITDLALDAGLQEDVVRTVLKSQRRNLLNLILRFARYGGDGESKIVFLEIMRSIAHCFKNARHVEGRLVSLSLFVSILKYSVRGFLSRFSFSRNAFDQTAS